MIPLEDRFSIAPLGLRMPGFFFFPGCCGCGPPDCGLASSTFGDLSGFTQVSGTWSALSSTAQTSSPSAVLKCDTTHPDGATANRTVIATLSATALGDKARLVVNYVDADNYLAVEVEFGSGSACGQVRVISRSGGTDTTAGSSMSVAGALAGDSLKLTAFYKPNGGINNLRVQVGTTRQFWRTVTAAGGSGVALATDSLTGIAKFSAFTFSYHFTSEATSCTVPICSVHSGVNECDFEVVNGTWSNTTTGSGALVWEPSTAGLLLATMEIGEGDSLYYLSAKPLALSGNNIGVVFDYVDEDNYHALVRVNDSGTLNSSYDFELRKRSGGVDTTICTVTEAQAGLNEEGFYLWIDDDFVAFAAGEDGDYQRWSAADVTLHGGRRVGFIADASPSGQFYSLEYKLATRCGNVTDLERPCSSFNRGVNSFTYVDRILNGKAPNEWQVEVSGIATNGSGSGSTINCTVANGTFICPPKSASEQSRGTRWQYRSPTTNHEVWVYGTDGSQLVVYIYVNNNGFEEPTATFVYNLTEEEQCDTRSISGQAMTLESTTGTWCDFSSSQVTITGLMC